MSDSDPAPEPPAPTGALGAALLDTVAAQFADVANHYLLHAAAIGNHDERRLLDLQPPSSAGKTSPGLSRSRSLPAVDLPPPQPSATLHHPNPNAYSVLDAQARIDVMLNTHRNAAAAFPAEAAFLDLLRLVHRLAKHTTALIILLNAALRWRLAAAAHRNPDDHHHPPSFHPSSAPPPASSDTHRELIADFILGYASARMLAASADVDWGPASHQVSPRTNHFEDFAKNRIRLYLGEIRPPANPTLRASRMAVADLYSRSLAALFFPHRTALQVEYLDRDIRFLINRRHAPAILAKMLGSANRVARSITTAAGLQTGDLSQGPVAPSDEVAAALMRSLSFARLDNARKWNEPVVVFLRYILDFSALPCAPLVQEAISDTLAQALSVVDPTRLPESVAWDEVTKALFDRFAFWVTSQKKAHLVYPGYAALLAIQRSTVYTTESPQFLRQCFKTYNSPKAQNDLRAASLRALRIFLKAEFVRSSKTQVKGQLDEVLQRVLLSYSHWAGNDRPLVVGLLVDIACKADPGISAQILQAMTDQGGDATIAVLKAHQDLFEIVQQDSLPLANTADDDMYHVKPPHTKDRPWLRNLSSPVALLLGKFSATLRALLVGIGAELAVYVLDFEVPIERSYDTKVLIASLRSWCMTLTYLGDGAIDGLGPETVPSELLFRFCCNTRKGVRTEAQRVLAATFLRYPAVRMAYLDKATKVLRDLATSYSKLIEELLAWISSLVATWLATLTAPSREEASIDVHKSEYEHLQARVIWLFFHSQGSVRLKARKLFVEIEDLLCLVDKAAESSLRPLQALRETPVSMVAGATTEDLKVWRKKLGNAFAQCCTWKDGKSFIPYPLRIIWADMYSMLPELKAKIDLSKKPELLKNKARYAAQDKAVQWRFFTTFCCAVLVVKRDSEEANVDILRSNSMAIEPKEAREVFRLLTSAWVTSQDYEQSGAILSHDDIRDAVPEALAHIHPLGIELLLPEIRRSIGDWLSNDEGGPAALRKLRKRKEVVRVQLEQLYRCLTSKLAKYKAVNLISPRYSSCYAQIEIHVRDTRNFVLRNVEESGSGIDYFRKCFLETVSELHEVVYVEVVEGNAQLDDDLVTSLFQISADYCIQLHTGHSSMEDVLPFNLDDIHGIAVAPHETVSVSSEARAVAAVLAVISADEVTFSKVLNRTAELFSKCSSADTDVIVSGLVKLCIRGTFWLKAIVDMCYPASSQDQGVSSRAFKVLADTITAQNSQFKIIEPNTELMALLTWKITHTSRNENWVFVARRAMEVLGELIHQWIPEKELLDETLPTIHQTSSGRVQRSAQKYVARLLSDYFPEKAIEMCKETSRRIEQSDDLEDMQNAFVSLASWVRVVNANELGFGEFLRDLLVVSRKSMATCRDEIGEMWQILSDTQHVAMIDFILDLLLGSLNEGILPWEYLQTYRFVGFCIFVKKPKPFLDRVVGCLTRTLPDHLTPPAIPFQALYTTSLSEPRSQFSLKDAAILLLADIVAESLPNQVVFYMPTCLTAALLALDRTHRVVLRATRDLLIACVNVAINSPATECCSMTHDGMRDLQETVAQFQTGRDWTIKAKEKFSVLVRDVYSLIYASNSPLANAWSKQALQFASQCPDVWYASKALVIVRCIGRSLSIDEARNLTLGVRLGLVQDLSDPSARALHLTACTDLVATIRSVVCSMPASELVLHPQLFWMCTCLIGADHSQLQLMSVEVVTEFVSRVLVTFPDRTQLGLFGISKPKAWHGFSGVQAEVLALVTCANGELSDSARVLVSLIVFTLDDPVRTKLFDCTEAHLAHVVVALLPWICRMLQNEPVDQDDTKVLRYYKWLQDHRGDHEMLRDTSEPCEAVAILLALACAQKSANRLAEVFILYSRSWKTLSLPNFLTTIRKPLAETFFPEQFHVVLSVLLSSIGQCGSVYLGILLQILWSVLHQVDVTKTIAADVNKSAFELSQGLVLAAHGPHAQLAIKVLDLAVHKFGIEIGDTDSLEHYRKSQLTKHQKFVWKKAASRIDRIPYPGCETVQISSLDRFPSAPLETWSPPSSAVKIDSQTCSYVSTDLISQIAPVIAPPVAHHPRMVFGNRLDEKLSFFRRVRWKSSKNKSRGLSLDSYASIFGEEKHQGVATISEGETESSSLLDQG